MRPEAQHAVRDNGNAVRKTVFAAWGHSSSSWRHEPWSGCSPTVRPSILKLTLAGGLPAGSPPPSVYGQDLEEHLPGLTVFRVDPPRGTGSQQELLRTFASHHFRSRRYVHPATARHGRIARAAPPNSDFGLNCFVIFPAFSSSKRVKANARPASVRFGWRWPENVTASQPLIEKDKKKDKIE